MRSRDLAAGLLFVSGAAALVYEVLWFKRFTHVWGSSSLAMAAVMAAFLLGLGLGARFLGKLADRLPSPTLGYAVCEAGIGAWALGMPVFLGWLRAGYGALYPPLAHLPHLRAALEILGALAVLGPPCVLMGATLPLLVREFVPRGEGLGVSASLFYAWNTLGGAVGCALAGFVLLPTLGLTGTRWLAVVTNALVVLAAVGLARRLARERAEAAAAEEDPRELAGPDEHDEHPRVLPPRPAGAGVVPLAAAATGCAALFLQLVWARQLALVLGGSTYAFCAMLSLVLAGIGIGSLLLPRLLARGLEPLGGLGLAVAFLVGTTLIGQHALPLLTVIVGDLTQLRASPGFNALLCLGASAGLQLLPCLAAGIVFPLLIHLTGRRRETAGAAVGAVTFWNTLGTSGGVLLAQTVLVPWVGTRVTLMSALVLYLAAFALVALRSEAFGRNLALGAAVLGIGLTAFATPDHDPRVTERGLFVYGAAGREALSEAAVLFHGEGATSNVLVTGLRGEVSLRVNGKVDASTFDTDQATQLGSAYLARFLRPHARDVFVIGFGSGATAGASLLFPRTRVTCAELERKVYEASPHFAVMNHAPRRSPDFTILFEDGRAHLQGTQETYDMIITEPSNPWMAGISNLFTLEFYELARERLTDDGLLAQWIQTYAITPEEYGMLLRTVREVFGEVALFRLTPGDTLVVASRTELLPSRTDVRVAQDMVDGLPAVTADLRRVLGDTDVASLLLRYLLLGEPQMHGLFAGQPVQTDDDLHLEFRAPLSLYQPRTRRGGELDHLLLAAVHENWTRGIVERLRCGPRQVNALIRLYDDLRGAGLDRTAHGLLRVALEVDPEHPRLVAERLIHDRESADEEADVDLLLVHSLGETLRVARAWQEADHHAKAAALLARLIEQRPGSATARAWSAVSLQALGRLDEATAALSEAVEIDPLNGAVLSALRSLRP
ncbi:MAG: fused MFS/spermidine synthase [Planctomycetota bacterium]|jgi:spermidine synthase|nr:fused MFS/spermidine synthase [Planctomycetota bacterium]